MGKAGTVTVGVGSSASGIGSSVNVGGGSSIDGDSGSVNIRSGPGSQQSSGNVTILTGQGTSNARSGNLVLATGTTAVGSLLLLLGMVSCFIEIVMLDFAMAIIVCQY